VPGRWCWGLLGALLLLGGWGLGAHLLVWGLGARLLDLRGVRLLVWGLGARLLDLRGVRLLVWGLGARLVALGVRRRDLGGHGGCFTKSCVR
jgi:hypothetical protein